MFDENNTEKKFVGSQKLNKGKNKLSNAHKIKKQVVHNGRDIKNRKTLFCTMRETMATERS